MLIKDIAFVVMLSRSHLQKLTLFLLSNRKTIRLGIILYRILRTRKRNSIEGSPLFKCLELILWVLFAFVLS